MRQSRIALNKDMDRVQRVFLVTRPLLRPRLPRGRSIPTSSSRGSTTPPRPRCSSHSRPMMACRWPRAGRIYLVDPLGNLLHELRADRTRQGAAHRPEEAAAPVPHRLSTRHEAHAVPPPVPGRDAGRAVRDRARRLGAPEPCGPRLPGLAGLLRPPDRRRRPSRMPTHANAAFPERPLEPEQGAQGDDPSLPRLGPRAADPRDRGRRLVQSPRPGAADAPAGLPRGAGGLPGPARHVDGHAAAQAAHRDGAPRRRTHDHGAALVARAAGRPHDAPVRRTAACAAWPCSGSSCSPCQILLGGWTSTNYAALACPDFPTCQRSFWPDMDFKDAFVLWRGLGIDYEGGVLDHPARVAIHFTHRLWRGRDGAGARVRRVARDPHRPVACGAHRGRRAGRAARACSGRSAR